MKKAILFMSLTIIASAIFAQKTSPSLRLKSFQRGYISGVAPTNTVELGGKETTAPSKTHTPEYFIYMIANKVPYLKIERVWIKQQLYLASIDKVATLPVVLQEGKKKDTLVKYTDEMVWQVKIIGKDSTGIKPKKDIANQVKSNELVIRLNDPSGHIYTRTNKQITVLEAVRGE
jgi:hypothetical protein